MIWSENTGESLVRSTNGGNSFSSFTSGETEAAGNFLFIAPFFQDPSNPATMWWGGAYIYRTTVATTVPAPAVIWTRASAFLGQRLTSYGIAPTDSNTVYVGGQTGSIWHSTAALSATGATVWPASRVRADSNYVSWLAVNATTPTTVYATVSTYNSSSGTGHIFKSTDGALTWTDIDGTGAGALPDVPVHCVVLDPNHAGTIYIATDIGVFVSLNDGASWNRTNTGFANVSVETLTIQNGYLYAFTHGRSAWRVPLT